MPFIAYAPVWSRYPTVAVALGSTEATLRAACTSISRSTIFPITTLAWSVRQSSQGPATPAAKAAKAQYPRKPHIRAAGASPIAKLAETAAATVRNKKTAAKPRASLSRNVRRQIAVTPPRNVVLIVEGCTSIRRQRAHEFCVPPLAHSSSQIQCWNELGNGSRHPMRSAQVTIYRR